MTRIVLFSDIHANLEALEAALPSVLAQQADAVYCLGDLGGYASQPNEVQEAVEALGCPVILGNYDENVGNDAEDCGCQYTDPFDIQMSDISFRWTCKHTSLQNKAKLREFPREIRFEAEGKRVLLCHGSPRSNTEYLFENRSDGYLRQFISGGKFDAHADVIAFGHTHVPYHREVDGVHFVNTGSVGRPKDGDCRAGYTVLTLTPDSVVAEQVRLEYDVETAAKKLVDAGLPEYFADYLRTGGNATKPTTLPST